MAFPDYDDRWEKQRESEERVYKWFNEFFYDPDIDAEQGNSRRYRWLPQDPINPYDVIRDRFKNDLPDSTIRDIANRLNHGSLNWRARPDEFPDKKQSDLPAFSGLTNVNYMLSRQQLLDDIASLKAAIESIRQPSSSFGHNNPPERISGDDAYGPELDKLSTAIAEIETEATSAAPNGAVIAKGQEKLIAFSNAVMTWSGARGTKFVDAILDSGGKALGAALVLQITGILPQIFKVIAASSKLISAMHGQ